MSDGGQQRFPEGKPRDADLTDNPGIGQSKGAVAAGGDLDDAEGDNTMEGDVENDTTPQGGVNPDRTGRTNK
jgi:hypothetical protein